MAKENLRSIMYDLVDACADKLGKEQALKAVRVFCRNFGGTMAYIPSKKSSGVLFIEIKATLDEYIGEDAAKIVIKKMMSLWGRTQIYIPFERTAFRDVIAEEIYFRNMNENISVSRIGRDYGIAFTACYELWKKGRKIKLNKERKQHGSN